MTVFFPEYNSTRVILHVHFFFFILFRYRNNWTLSRSAGRVPEISEITGLGVRPRFFRSTIGRPVPHVEETARIDRNTKFFRQNLRIIQFLPVQKTNPAEFSK